MGLEATRRDKTVQKHAGQDKTGQDVAGKAKSVAGSGGVVEHIVPGFKLIPRSLRMTHLRVVFAAKGSSNQQETRSMTMIDMICVVFVYILLAQWLVEATEANIAFVQIVCRVTISQAACA